jgi:hypothetical protein
VVVDDQVCVKGICSQKITLTPEFELESADHKENNDSYITVVLMVVYETETSVKQTNTSDDNEIY